jgi:AAA+ superfamily predicted ATPase
MYQLSRHLLLTLCFSAAGLKAVKNHEDQEPVHTETGPGHFVEINPSSGDDFIDGFHLKDGPDVITDENANDLFSELSALNLADSSAAPFPAETQQDPDEMRAEKVGDTLVKLNQKTAKKPEITGRTPFKSNDIEFVQYPAEPENTGSANSGYHALKNAAITLVYGDAPDFEGKLKAPTLSHSLFGEDVSPWRAAVITARRRNLLASYIKDQLLVSVRGGKKISYEEITSFDVNPLALEEFVVSFDKEIYSTSKAREDVSALANLLTPVAKNLAGRAPAQTEIFSFTPEQIFAAIEEEVSKKAQETGRSFSFQKKEHLVEYFPGISTISCTIVSTKNKNELFINGVSLHTRKYDKSGLTDGLNGDWLSENELIELFEHEKNTLHVLIPAGQSIEAKSLEFSKESSFAAQIQNELTFKWLLKGLEQPKFDALLFIGFEKQWTACLVRKRNKQVTLTLTDSSNVNRQKEPSIKKLLEQIEQKLNKKTRPSKESKKTEDFLQDLLSLDPSKKTATEPKAEEVMNYDAPLASLSLDEIPTLEQLFGGKVPNNVLVRIAQIKNPEPATRGAGTKVKNCLMLYGPPGTGKSTIAQVIIRRAGKNVLYVSGGKLRTDYMGSGPKLIGQVFDEAKKRKNCVILIDEIDGTASKLEPRGHTQEDNRTVKALITTLDQYRHDPDIFVICTTNMPDRMDPAILRRFNAIEIPLPNFEMRKAVLLYYLEKNGIEINSKKQDALSSDFFDKLLTATEGFSGDALGDMVNNAVHEFRFGLKPEESIGLGFRFNSFDLKNRSVISNALETIALPLIPAYHWLNGFSNTEFDKHLYTAFRRHQKLKDDIDEREKKDDPANRYAKDPLWKRWAKIAATQTLSSMHHSIFTTVGSKMLSQVLPQLPDHVLTRWLRG